MHATYVHTYSTSYKKLTFFARHMGMGTDVLRAMDKHATGTDTGVNAGVDVNFL